ncbi:class I SAM-dependent methyltransferase [Candidatus Gottesmanbacteria bacterium]|nr:class I SAM-dependent methyltransferase [Candidatus Gottesmanbacteria bacterium]MBI5452149.1 class I SAM-dependent methyltransferase [Candidatus Gottesmanbacteria bacterium]
MSLNESEIRAFHSRLKESTRIRIQTAYQFTAEEIAKRTISPVGTILDFGTYDGSFLPILLNIGKKVISFDYQWDKLAKAKAQENLQPYILNKRLELLSAKAQDVAIAPESIDLATVFEIFGAGFIGTPDDVYRVFQHINRVLKPGSYCALTVRSKTFDEMFAPLLPINVIDDSDFLVYRRDITPMLKEFGGTITWYGQTIYPHNKEVIFPVVTTRDQQFTGHAQWSSDAFKPRTIPDLTRESPVYWLGIWQKPG